MNEDFFDAAHRVRSAVTNEGINPEYHRAQLEHLRKTWPTLYNSLMSLVEAGCSWNSYR